jgi:hypothetical protein
MTKFTQEYAVDNGWSDWIYPVMKGYKMACCDCGLVHDLEFRIVENGKRVEFRARRNNRSTGQIRRHQGIKVKKSI